ncbi:MAG: stage II sporulation protein D [Oscillospiraceae bacterium]|nr:stage II sporulation protein D [Oscillospiraceae bacterium]
MTALLILIPVVGILVNPPSTPAAAMAVPESEPVQEPPAAVDAAPEIPVPEIMPAVQHSPNGVDSFLIYDMASGEVETVSLRDYVLGAVASEMPAVFHPEAMKAQAVAAHTFALHNHHVRRDIPDPALHGADFAADPSGMRVYITEETAREFWGEDYADEFWAKISAAADSVLGYILEYDDEPIAAAYHAISAGRTEDAANVWTGSADYLVPAESGGDFLAPDFEVTQHFTAEEAKHILANLLPGISLPDDPALWFSEIEHSPSGYVTAVTVGGERLHGKDIRTAFGLRSHSMDISYDGRGFGFTTYGHGHGVGLSQYGADFMARQGYTFEQILAHYYPGAQLRAISAGFADGV